MASIIHYKIYSIKYKVLSGEINCGRFLFAVEYSTSNGDDEHFFETCNSRDMIVLREEMAYLFRQEALS